MKKISKVGLAFAIVNAVIVITIAYLDSLNTSRGFGLVAILWMEMPATFIIMPAIDFIERMGLHVSPFISISVLASIIGGLQWYFIGWLIEKIYKKIFTRPKVKEQFK